jgi:NADPH2:quinone reductase
MPWRLAIWEKLAADWKPTALDAIAHRTIGLDELPAACAEVMAGRVQGRYLVNLGNG